MTRKENKMSNGEYKLAVLVLGLLCCSAVLEGCKTHSDGEVAPLVAVQAEHPEIGDISEHIAADATLAPLAQAAISPKITAPVKAFYVQRGSKVRAGQLLAELENRDLAGQALDSKGQYDAAQASFEMQTKAQVPEDYAKAELDVAQAKAQLNLQSEIVGSRQKLFQQGAIAGRDYDTAVAALAQAQVAYDNARNHLMSLTNVSRKATVQQAEGQLSSAKGKYQTAEAQVSYSRIVSPISGVVTDRSLFPGETAASGAPLLTIMDTSALLAKVHLSQTVAQRLNIGDEAAVMIPGVDTSVTAKVSLISPALDPGSTTVEVWLRIENSPGKYKAGTPVRASIVGRTAFKAVKIPLSAVLTGEDGTKSVMIVQPDLTAHKVNVKLGISDGDDIQVLGGLSGSETVIASGAYGLDDGTKVKIGKADEGDKK
jgi:HlyD family secretion protein